MSPCGNLQQPSRLIWVEQGEPPKRPQIVSSKGTPPPAVYHVTSDSQAHHEVIANFGMDHGQQNIG